MQQDQPCTQGEHTQDQVLNAPGGSKLCAPTPTPSVCPAAPSLDLCPVGCSQHTQLRPAAASLTFRASWNMGTPGWYTQEPISRDEAISISQGILARPRNPSAPAQLPQCLLPGSKHLGTAPQPTLQPHSWHCPLLRQQEGSVAAIPPPPVPLTGSVGNCVFYIPLALKPVPAQQDTCFPSTGLSDSTMHHLLPLLLPLTCWSRQADYLGTGVPPSHVYILALTGRSF